MCSRRDVEKARKAQDKAADALAGLCANGLCSDDLGMALHNLYDTTLGDPVPDQFKALVDKLQ